MQWLPTPVFLPGEFHGQRSLVSCSPWGHKESDMTEQLTHTHMHVPWPRAAFIFFLIFKLKNNLKLYLAMP